MLPTALQGRSAARRLRLNALVVVVALVTLAGSIPSAAAGAVPDDRDRKPALAVGPGGFSDAAQAGGHLEAVESLAGDGVFEGTECSPGRFCPREPLQRWVMAVWLVRILDGADPAPAGSSRFADVDASVWWAPFVDRLADLGVTAGCRTGPPRYCPGDTVTRAQMASFLTRAFQLEAATGPAGFVDIGGTAHLDNINALASAGITAGCATGPLRYCPREAVTRAQMASFLNRARGGGSAGGPLEVVDYQRINELLSSLGALDQTEGCAATRVPASVDEHIEVMRIEDGCVLIEYEPLDGRSVAEARRLLAADPTVVAADLPVVDFDLSHDYSAKDPDAGLQWHLPQVDAKELWDGWPDDAEVTVAVIDSGVDATHGDLEPNVAGGGLACHRRDYSGHGTHVAGIAGAVAENGIAVAGIAPRATILSIKMPLGNVPPDPECEKEISSLAQAIKVAVEGGADVINMSLGRVWYWEFPTTLAAAIHLATTSGVVLVAAAGNRGESFANRNAPEIPAIHSDVIAVGAATESSERAGFSTSNRWVNVAAPGNIIYSTVPCDRDDCGTGIKSGTSMATPLVSGLVAHMKARYPDAAPAEIRKAIYDTARQPGSSQSRVRTDDFGWGIIRPLAAIEALGEMVGDTNAAPQFTSSPHLSAAENTTHAGSVTAIDEDDSITGYALSGGADLALFDIDGAGTLEFSDAPDYESPADSDQDNTYEISVSVSSGSGNRALTSEQAILVTVTDTTEPPDAPVAPTLEPAVSSLAVSWLEPSGAGPAVDDYDLQYRAVGVTTWDEQAHTGTGRTATVAGLTSNTGYEVRVRATNAEGTSGWSTPATAVTAINAPPVFNSPASVEVRENTTGAGTVRASDSDSQDNVVAFNISGGDDADLLSVDRNTGVLTFNVAPDYEAPADHDRNNIYEIVVNVTSGTGTRELASSQYIAVTVTDDTGETAARVPDPPSLTITGATETSLTLGWQQPAGPPVGDYDLQYRATGSANWSDWPHLGSALTATITALDSGTGYEVRVRATNAEGTGEWSNPFVATTRGNRAPQFTSPSSLTVREPTQQIAEVKAVDSDREDTVNSYGIDGGADRALLTIDGAGSLAFIEPPNYEAPHDADGNNRYEVVVAATSGTGTRLKTATQRITIRVIDDTAEAPANPQTVNYEWVGSEIVLSWDAVAGADYYKVYYDDFFGSSCSVRGGSASFCEELATDVTGTSYTHADPDPDDNYYWVVACNSSGCSEVDSGSPAGTVGTPPTTPIGRYEWVGSEIVLSWDAVAGADYYKVYYDDFFGSSCSVRGGSASFCEE
ncbi:MAG: S8 family serine peptidase, partial [bacterium]|nr:S8 family serine peptidase [bacterium]